MASRSSSDNKKKGKSKSAFVAVTVTLYCLNDTRVIIFNLNLTASNYRFY